MVMGSSVSRGGQFYYIGPLTQKFSEPSRVFVVNLFLFRWAGSLLPGGEEVSWSGLARGVGLANILEGLDAHFQVNLFKGIVEPFELGGEARLIRSPVKY